MAIALQTQAIDGTLTLYIGPSVLVASASAPGSWWIVDSGRCSCPGFEHRGRCKHLAIAARAEGLDRESAQEPARPICIRCRKRRRFGPLTPCASCAYSPEGKADA